MAHNVPRTVTRLRHADPQGVRRLPDHLSKMARVRLKSRLCEVIVIDFAVPALDDRGGGGGSWWEDRNMARFSPTCGWWLCTSRLVRASCAAWCWAVALQRRAEDQGRYAMLGAVVVMLRQDGLPKGRHVERRRGMARLTRRQSGSGVLPRGVCDMGSIPLHGGAGRARPGKRAGCTAHGRGTCGA